MSAESDLIALRQVEKVMCEKSFEQFVRSAWDVLEPSTKLVWSWHLTVICEYLEAVNAGKIKRLIINVPPGSMKSLLVSVFYPSWVWIKKPQHRFLSVANSDRLATRDAQKQKWLVSSNWYQNNWDIKILGDQSAKSQFGNDKYGLRQSIGVKANVTGLRGDTQLWDDLLSSDDAYSDAERDAVKLAIDQKLINRLNDPNEGAIILIMQRLHEEDPTGHLLKSTKENWVVLKIPMEFEESPAFNPGKDIGKPELADPRTKKGEIMDKRTNKASLAALKERLGDYGSAGQLQQRPVPAGGGIIKSHWWRIWADDKPVPVCDHVFLSWDTAFSEDDMKKSAFSACTRWGVFWHEQKQRYCLICLGRWIGRVGYDELRKIAIDFDTEFKPDSHLIEKKATGISLIQDLKRALKCPVRAYSPGRGEDKISRAHSVSPMFESGMIFIPYKKWATNKKDNDGLIEYVASFPNGAPPSADLTDTVTQALIYLRSGWWVSHPDDEDYDDKKTDEKQPRVAAYG